MRIVMFCHSLMSDWNHGSAHFLRGVACELLARGVEVRVYERRGAWSVRHLLADHGPARWPRFTEPIQRCAACATSRPASTSTTRSRGPIWFWCTSGMSWSWSQRLGEHRARRGRYQLLFHDTHHRAATNPAEMAGYRLDRMTACSHSVGGTRPILDKAGLRGWTWHEAADIRRSFDPTRPAAEGDLVWIGNWGDDERGDELREFLIEPARTLGLRTRVYGVRYPAEAQKELAAAGIEYAGWLPNYEVPRVFARHRATVHIPRRPFAQALPGIPTIRVFEALACGIPLVSAPWEDTDGLFTPGEDFLLAGDGEDMRCQLARVLRDPSFAAAQAARGFRTIRERHTCAHRVDELLAIYAQLVSPRGGVAA